MKFDPYKKNGWKRFSHADAGRGGGGGTTSFEVSLALIRELQVSAILEEGAKKCHPLKEA